MTHMKQYVITVKLPRRHATEAFQIRSPKKMKLNIEYKAAGHIAKPKKMG